jgi:hypothetical protein
MRRVVRHTHRVLPRFEVVHRTRPVALVLPGSDLERPVAPYLAVEAVVTGPGRAELALASGDVTLIARYDDRGLSLEVTAGGTTTTHRSRRHGQPEGAVAGVALTLTGPHLVVLSHEDGAWLARGRVDLTDRVDTHDETWLARVEPSATGPLAEVRSGRFGQIGLRDLRLVTHADGTAYRDGDAVLLTATSAGPGHFAAGHLSVWRFEPDSLALSHRADLYVRRPGRPGRPGVYGDHAGHLLRDGDTWRLATSTWGDFDRSRDDASVAVTVAVSTADLTTGAHVLDSRPLALPTTGLRSVGVWDPYLVRTPEGWLAGYVSATRFFRFHPVVAEGPDLDSLTLRAAASDRRATEGTTLQRLDGDWRVLASDGRDGRRGQRERYPVFDLDLVETGALDAPYPSNISWPTLLEHDGRWLMIGFNGARYGGLLVGYGSHGAVVIART